MKALLKKQEAPFIYSKHYLMAQKEWAERMSIISQGFSKKKLVFLLVLFTVLSAGYFLYNIYTALSGNASSIEINAGTSKIKAIH
ncbi:hypothetical protein [Flavobacterium sp. F52]|uniref:hypothetical protein n=1 Tax=Flavobacterium sp. F52 TaxID=1202532 RepID=UPI000272D4FA|nr:hypothetical protein [Flavobacterium sp. F52]EJG03147.1 hypothetical protein FF52_03105 [Flavobacterium sp. F52]